eukprot:TRINITY_DN811_c0_g1_i8.p1 TRINITY_DN811_c0_g1~~TRINITY_DN811_c0_g1_i8.p1  ORF type:complete len:1431 (+),score=436.85 TRINITY_DN811_c0_g1_i8:149-4441(+)
MESDLSHYFFLDDEKVVKGNDIIFKNWEETLFGVFHLICGAKFSRNSKTTMKEKAFHSLRVICEALMIAAISTGYMTLHSSKLPGERVSFFDLSPFSAISKWGGEDAIITLFCVLSVAIIGQAAILGFLMATFKSRNIQNATLMTFLRQQFIWMNVVCYPVILEFLLSLTRCSTLRDMVDDTEYECWTGGHLLLAIGGGIISTIFFLMSLLSSYLMFDFNPTSTSLLTMAHGRVEIMTVLVKTMVVLAFYAVHSPCSPYMTIFCAVLLTFQAGTYIFRLPHYGIRVNWLKAGLYGCLVTLMGIASLFHMNTVVEYFELTDRTVVKLGFAFMPFMFLFFSRFASSRDEQFRQIFSEQITNSNRVGDRFQWEAENSDMMKERTLKRLLNEMETQLLHRGMFSTWSRRSFFATDAELVARPLQTTTLSTDSYYWKKMIFLSRLHFAKEIESNPEDAMICAMYAVYLWFFTHSINDTNNAMRAAMARKPSLDVKYMVYSIIRFCETYKQTYTAEGGDIVKTLEMRKNHEKVVGMHNDCLKRIRNMWKVLSKADTRAGKSATKIIRSCVEQVIKTQTAYSMILLKFPNAREVMLHFAIFRRDILQDENGSKMLLSRARNIDAGDCATLDHQSSNGSSSILESNMSTDVFQLISASNRKFLTQEMSSFSTLKKRIIGFAIMFVILCCLGLSSTHLELSVVKDSIDSVQDTGRLMVAASDMGLRMSGMDYYARHDETDTYNTRHEQFMAAIESLKQYSFDIFDTAKNNGVTKIESMYENNNIDMSLPNMSGEFESQKVNFHSMTTNIVTASRTIGEMTMEEFANRDNVQAWKTIQHNLMTAIPNASENLLETQVTSATDTINSTINLHFQLSICVIVLCLCLTVHSAIKMSQAFSLFSQKVPSYVFLCQDLPPVEVRKEYQHRCSQKNKIELQSAFDRGHQDLSDDEKEPEFCEEVVDNGNGNINNVNNTVVEEQFDVDEDVDTALLSEASSGFGVEAHHLLQKKNTGLSSVMSTTISGATDANADANGENHLDEALEVTHDNPSQRLMQVIDDNGVNSSDSDGSIGSESKMANHTSPNFGIAFTNADIGDTNHISDKKKTGDATKSIQKSKSLSTSRRLSTKKSSQSLSETSQAEDTNEKLLKKRSILASLTSRYAWKLLLTIFSSVLVFMILNVYSIRSELEGFDDLNTEMKSAVLIRHFIDTAVVDSFELVSGYDVFRDKPAAKEANIRSANMMMNHWNCVMFGDCLSLNAMESVTQTYNFAGAAFRNSDRERLLFNDICLLGEGKCEADRYVGCDAADHGLNELIFQLNAAHMEIISEADSFPVPTDFVTIPTSKFLTLASLSEGKAGLETVVEQFIEEKNDLASATDTLLWGLSGGTLLYAVFVYFITWLVLLRSIRQEMKLTYFFLSMIPSKLMQTSRFIQAHCVQSNQDS